MALPEQANPAAQMAEAEKQRLRLEGFMAAGQERGGSMEALRVLRDAETVSLAIQELSATMVGLPAVDAIKEVLVAEQQEDGTLTITNQVLWTVTFSELMQIFPSPDWNASEKGAGYYAKATLESALSGSTRDDVLAGTTGPGKYSRDEAQSAVALAVEKKKLEEKDVEKTMIALQKCVRPEAVKVAEVLKDEAKRFAAREQVWGAFRYHQMTAGDEKSGAGLFVEPSHIAPMGADWLEFFSGDGQKRDKALRQIYAAGLSWDQLKADGKDDYSIEGIHWGKRAIAGKEKEFTNAQETGDWDDLQEGVHFDRVDVWNKSASSKMYARGFNSENFSYWMKALLKQTDNDLLAAYDAWYTAIVTGLVAKVAVDGVVVGDPPIVSSIDAWLLHFGEKQANEAGLNAEGRRVKQAKYKGKIGPEVGLGKYQSSWLGSFFDSAKIQGKTIKESTVFHEWWHNDVSMDKIPWLNTDQTVGGQDEEVRLGSYDGWLYSKFQMFNLLDSIQKTPALKDVTQFTFWFGFARSMDKAFGPVWDIDNPEKRVLAAGNGVDVSLPENRFSRDNAAFIKVVPDSENPRVALFRGIVARYSPIGFLRDEIPVDASVALSDRFSSLSEINLNKDVTAKLKQLQDPGTVLLENYIVAVVESGMLDIVQAYNALGTIVKPDKLKNTFASGTPLGNRLRSSGRWTE